MTAHSVKFLNLFEFEFLSRIYFCLRTYLILVGKLINVFSQISSKQQLPTRQEQVNLDRWLDIFLLVGKECNWFHWVRQALVVFSLRIFCCLFVSVIFFYFEWSLFLSLWFLSRSELTTLLCECLHRVWE